MEFARREFAAAVNALPEAERLYATLAYWEETNPTVIVSELGLSASDVERLRETVAHRLAWSVPVPPREVGRLRRRALNALVARCRATTGAPLDADNRVDELASAVVPTVGVAELRAAAADIRSGDGGELRSRNGRRPSFHSAYSSCAHAVSTFGPWRLDPSTLSLFGGRGFTSLRFEAKCPIRGIVGRAPNLDVVAEADGEVVAVESKLTEYITNRKTAKFREPYADAVKGIAHGSWASQFSRLRKSPQEFRFFDAAQIVKHYLGLKSRYAAKRVTLAYLFWEPTDASSHPLFAQHRAEVESFATKLRDPKVRFLACSCGELWSDWAHRRSPPWLPSHRAVLVERYGVALD